MSDDENAKECIKKFKQLSENPCVHAFEGSLMHGNNFHFYTCGWGDSRNYSKNEIKQLKAQLEKAIKALEFYGDKDSWILSADEFMNDIDTIQGDDLEDFMKPTGLIYYGGKRARQTLKELKGE